MLLSQHGTLASSMLDTDQGEGIQEQFKVAAKQLDDRVNFHTSHVSVDEYSDLPTPLEHDQSLVDQNLKLPPPLGQRLHLSK